jgi:8-amino-7-oxononanoate synthase
MPRFDFLAEQLQALAAQGRHRALVARQIDGPWMITADGQRLINFGSNDYLGLASRSALRERNETPNRGSGASALICGWSPSHQRLAEAIARLEQTEAVVLFPSGYAACCGTVATLAQSDDLILSDQLNHASLIDGCRLSRAQSRVYRHRDCDEVEKILASSRGEFDQVWIVTDGVFGMDGHVAPLVRLCELAERYQAHVVVDEAHGTGVLGAQGSGVCEALGVKDRVPIRIGTLSKAIGAQGGFVAAPQVVVDFLVNRCRSLIFSTALSPTAVVAAQNALDVIGSQPQLRSGLRQLSRLLRRELTIDVSEPEAGVPIVPIIVGDDQWAVEASARLAAAGIYVPAIRPPTVPAGSARLRVSLSAVHDQAMVEQLVRQLRAMDLIPPPRCPSRSESA